MKKANKRFLLTICAVTLSLCVTVGVAFAYFTDYEMARGTAVVKLSGQTVIDEQFEELDKVITILNNGEGDVIVRVGVYGPDEMKYEFDSGDWYHSETDGFWYYKHVLHAGSSTSPLKVLVGGIPVGEATAEMDITVVHESLPLAAGDDGYYIVPDGWEKVVPVE